LEIHKEAQTCVEALMSPSQIGAKLCVDAVKVNKSKPTVIYIQNRIHSHTHVLTIPGQNIDTLRPRDEPKRRNNYRRIYRLIIQIGLCLIHIATYNLQPL